jgi:PAS domain S-box-containing protein
MEVGLFLRIAASLASTLARLHSAGLIHRDIKPANVLVDAATGGAWLTGFGLASRLSREHPSLAAPETVVGTLAYMPPEQTGRVNRSIDARSDLYALGVTLYQMATGALPFAVVDPLELVHCHIARQAMPPFERNPAVPAAISAIIMKLLAKAPEDRYQSGAGLEADLRRFLATHQSGVNVEPFTLGAHDIPDVLRIPEKLYGREQSIQELMAAFERTATGAGSELVLISGYSGIGKSAVVRELQKALSSTKAFFAAGKCDQLKRDVPYAALAQALQTLAQSILRTTETDLARWRDAIKRAVEPNGQLVASLVPDFELIIGKQPQVPDLPPQDSRNRFHMVFRSFLQVFATPAQPLVLFLDDLQWSDSATLALVEELVGEREMHQLLLIGAYRDNETGPSHPLVLTLDALRRAGKRVTEINLAPLQLGDLCRLVASALHSDEHTVGPLARLVAERTGGNPFFAIQFLTELSVESLLAFDPAIPAWTWDLARIADKSYTDNIVQLMVGKLKRLPPAVQQCLTDLACLGHAADLATLATLRERSTEEIHGTFQDAVNAGLIVRRDSGYRFTHDRVQEAAYALIPKLARPATHLRIGRRLRAAAEHSSDRVFATVNQLNHAVDLITAPEERLAVLRLNAAAGGLAKDAVAYASARNYLAQAVALVAAGAWTRDYDATLALHLELAECEYLVGGFDAADRLFDQMLTKARSDLDRARIHSLHMKVCLVGGGYDESLRLALEALKLFGVTFPESDDDIQAATDEEFRAVSINLGGRRICDLINAPLAVAPEVRAIIELLVDAVPSAYNGRPALFPLMAMRAVNVSLQNGNTDQSSYAYAVHALMLVGVYAEMAQAFEFSEMALQLNERFNNVRLRGALLHLHGDHVNFWRRHFSTGVPILEQGLRSCLEVGDLVYAGHIEFLSIWQAIERGDPLGEVCALAERNSVLARDGNNDAVYQTIQLERRFVMSLQGRTSDPMTGDANGTGESASLAAITKAAFGCGIAFHQIMRQVLAFMNGRYDDAMEAARLAEPMLGATMATPIEATHHFYSALTLTALYPDASAPEQDRISSLLDDKLMRLKRWADNCPENYLNRYALVRAEIARIQGRTAEAMDLYETAIRSARDNGFVQNEALAFELAAQFYAARGFSTFAHAYMRNARDGYLRWGAEGKVRQLDEMYARQREAASNSPASLGVTIEQLDLGTVVKVSEAIAGEIVFEKLIDTLMRMAIVHAGAERGLLILPRGEAPQIAAEATTRGNEVMVALRQSSVTAADLPESVLRYVFRTKESVLLADASISNPFSGDSYIREHRARSVLCLPIVKQARLLGAMYLENNLSPHAFTPSRMAILRLLASEAAVSMENASLYRDLAEREARIRRLVDANIIGIIIWDIEGRILEANDAFLRMVGYDREDLISSGARWTDMTPPEWRERDEQQLMPELRTTGSLQPFEKEFYRKDGSRVPVLVGVASFEEGGYQGVAFVLDLTERKGAADALRELQLELTHANRLATMGQLVATIAHEVNQPIAATRNNAHAALHFLDAYPPDIVEIREALECVVNDTYRAGEIVGRIRDQVKKLPPHKESIDLNSAIEEVIALVRGELTKNRVSVRTILEEGIAPAYGDRVQLQQVMLNLILNAIEAMIGVDAAARELVISTEIGPSNGLLVAVGDSGPGVALDDRERIFESFYTTKDSGVGIGLSICRSIIESHGGQLWVDSEPNRGAVFRFALPGYS